MKAYYGTKLILAEPAYNDADGYKVRYSDGYESWSPKAVFEEAYQPMNALSFGHAIRVLKDGKRVARAGWNGKNMWLKLQVPDANSKMSLPYIYMFTAQGDRVPWLASQTDVLADDWQLVG